MGPKDAGDGSGHLHLDVRRDGASYVVRLSGELDIVDADRLHAALHAIGAAAVVADLSNLKFLDGAGLSALVSARHRWQAEGHTFTVRGAEGMVRRVFEITGQGELLDGAT
ncbi:MAG: STAS domain-containing protein [Acidimicrobiales bacterium]